MSREPQAAGSDPRLAGYHLDTLDLYSANHRSAFARAAAQELAIEEAVVARDLGHLLLRLEALQDQAIQQAPEGLGTARLALWSEEERQLLSFASARLRGRSGPRPRARA